MLLQDEKLVHHRVSLVKGVRWAAYWYIVYIPETKDPGAAGCGPG